MPHDDNVGSSHMRGNVAMMESFTLLLHEQCVFTFEWASMT
jgi:hypothetical protein